MFCTTECWDCNDRTCEHYINKTKLYFENENNKKEIERLNKKIAQYENPEDMTLMFMWCNEKAKDEIKRLNNIIGHALGYIECANKVDITYVCKILKGEDKE